MTNDNWAGRATDMKCQRCMWFGHKANGLGRCKRRAPTMSGFPAVFRTDWCGDHKLDEAFAVPTPEPPKRSPIARVHLDPVPSGPVCPKCGCWPGEMHAGEVCGIGRHG